MVSLQEVAARPKVEVGLGLPLVKSPALYTTIFGLWAAASAVLWTNFLLSFNQFGTAAAKLLGGLAVAAIDISWLYGFYHFSLVLFILKGRRSAILSRHSPPDYASTAPIAILHTICDDFQIPAVQSCISQDYPDYHVYLLDDSTDEETKRQVDEFQRCHAEKVTILRRSDRRGFKAGNLNHCLARLPEAIEYVALADSDSNLPVDFLTRTAQLLDTNQGAFVQALHVANPSKRQNLARDLGEIVRIGWEYYQPARNRYGFPMCYGHGALLRRAALQAAGGFPEIVSEDIALTLRIRRLGVGGLFTDRVICGEDYPDDYHTFRKRLSRWVPADLECFWKELLPFLLAKNTPAVEKLDAFLRGMKLPLSVLFLPMTVLLSAMPGLYPAWENALGPLVPWIALPACLAPFACFTADMAGQPKRLAALLSQLSVMYCSTSLLLVLRGIEALALRKARFYVTGAKRRPAASKRLRSRFFSIDEAGYPLFGYFELLLGLALVVFGVRSGNLVLAGIGAAVGLAPVYHHGGWERRAVVIHLPSLLIFCGLALSGLFGYSTAAQILTLAGLAILLF